MARRVSKYMKSEEENNSKIFNLLPKNENQQLYINSIRENTQTIVTGPAGTGKTFVAATEAANLYLCKEIDRIILTRPNIGAGKSLGYFPGTLEDKMDPWMKPITDVLRNRLGANKYENDVKKGNIEVAPFETMRGRSFDNSFIILDEAQNTDITQLKMFMTRIGVNTKVVVNGDVNQTDLDKNSGLARLIKIAKDNNIKCGIVEFEVDDIVRSDITKEWIIAFDKEKV